jgi:hypothetical protein
MTWPASQGALSGLIVWISNTCTYILWGNLNYLLRGGVKEDVRHLAIHQSFRRLPSDIASQMLVVGPWVLSAWLEAVHVAQGDIVVKKAEAFSMVGQQLPGLEHHGDCAQQLDICRQVLHRSGVDTSAEPTRWSASSLTITPACPGTKIQNTWQSGSTVLTESQPVPRRHQTCSLWRDT